MEESYKEMYMELYRSMIFLQDTLEKLNEGISEAFNESIDMYLAHFRKEAEGQSLLEKRFRHRLKED